MNTKVACGIFILVELRKKALLGAFMFHLLLSQIRLPYRFDQVYAVNLHILKLCKLIGPADAYISVYVHV